METEADGSAVELPDLLDRRIIIVSGKGGTGKTTVAAALALAAAEARGKNVLAAEVGTDEHLPRLLSPGARSRWATRAASCDPA